MSKSNGTNGTNTTGGESGLGQIVQLAIKKEPSQIGPIVNKEIASRVMSRIDDKRREIGSKLFR